ncbi:hypothetical protein F0562_015613 [Nyssa sinensis]|uniref:Uncharacterized protein n=1 Tax=Nyssa sinensis TaxID=561372 RepID=A0A5J4ZJB4_9ASTE|nr:hypothetical protein F0562_015613 [Nyssa sinensis]
MYEKSEYRVTCSGIPLTGSIGISQSGDGSSIWGGLDFDLVGDRFNYVHQCITFNYAITIGTNLLQK